MIVDNLNTAKALRKPNNFGCHIFCYLRNASAGTLSLQFTQEVSQASSQQGDSVESGHLLQFPQNFKVVSGQPDGSGDNAFLPHVGGSVANSALNAKLSAALTAAKYQSQANLKPSCGLADEESEFVIKTTPIGLIAPAVSLYGRVQKPLRKIVSRTPQSVEIAPDYILVCYIDTLSCGHQVTTYKGEESKKRRGCQECLDAQIASKKPVQSVGKKVA